MCSSDLNSSQGQSAESKCLRAQWIPVAIGQPAFRQTCTAQGSIGPVAAAVTIKLVLPRRWTSLSRFRRSALFVFRGALLIGAITAIAYQLRLNSASAALLYLVAVVLQSLDCGFLEAAIVSVLATAALDYYLIEPRFTFNVTDPLDAVTLAGLLVVSLVVTRIQVRSRAQAKESRLQRNNMEALYKVGQELLALAPAAVAGPALLDPFVSVFELSAVCLFDAATLECHISGRSRSFMALRV